MFNEVYEKRRIRSVYSPVINWAKSLPESTILKRKSEAENLFKKIGITFSVYNNYDTSERLIPFDMFPRILSKTEWKKIQSGVVQRSMALNAFLNDIYKRLEWLDREELIKRFVSAEFNRFLNYYKESNKLQSKRVKKSEKKRGSGESLTCSSYYLIRIPKQEKRFL
mgnify:CR=1 FL=1